MAAVADEQEKQHTGGMIALVPSPDSAAKLTVTHPAAEDPDELHTTIGYLGDDVMAQLDASQRGAVLAAAAQAAAQFPPIDASVMGHAAFNPDDPDRDPCAVYLVTGDGLAGMRGELAEHDRSEFPIWLPHLTAGYGVPTSDLSYTGPITYDRLRVALAGQYHDFPLTGVDEGDDDEGDDAEEAAETSAEEAAEHDPLDEDDVEVKKVVASQAGVTRYGKPIGTQLGQARDANAAQAQNNPRAKDQYDTLVNANPRDYRAMLDGMDAADLKSLSAMAYSFRSSNTTVVQARLAIAAALARKGLDVNDYGGLGKSKAKTAAHAKARGKAPAKGKAVAKTTSGTGRNGGTGAGRPGSVDRRGVGQGEVSDKEYNRLLAEGWKTQGGRLYPPTKGADVDGYESFAPDVEVAPHAGGQPVEGKAATGKGGKPVAKSGDKTPGKAKCRFCTADATHKVRRADSPGGVGACGKHLSLAKAAGGKVLGVDKLGDGDDADSGKGGKDDGKAKGKAKSTPPWVKGKALGPEDLATLDPVTLVGLIESKVMSPDPRAAKLREYWAHGKGVAKWRPGTPGDFDRLKRAVRKFIPPEMLNGWVANVHKLATGEWPGKNAHGGKSLDAWFADGVEVKAGSALLSVDDLDAADSIDPDSFDDDGADDAVSLALDHYGDMADELSSEEAYEQSLADQVDWQITADGTLAPAPPSDVGVIDLDKGDGDGGGGGGDDGDSGDPDADDLDPAATLEALFA